VPLQLEVGRCLARRPSTVRVAAEPRPSEIILYRPMTKELTIDQAFALAERHRREGRLPQALALTEQLITAAPGHGDALQLMGVLSAESGNVDEGIEWLLKALEVAPGACAYLADLGYLYCADGQLKVAEQYCLRAIEAAPDHLPAHTNLGNVYWGLNDLNRAVTCFLSALSIDPEHVQSLNNLGATYRRQGLHSQALDAHQQALVLAPQDVDARFNLANAMADLGDYTGAVAQFRQVLAGHSEHFSAHLNLSKIECELGEHDSAERHAMEALRVGPEDPSALGALASAVCFQGNFQKAIEVASRSLALEPNGVGAWTTLGNAQRHLGALEAARASYDEGLMRDPEHPGARLGRSVLDLSLGHYQLGWRDYRYRWQCGELKFSASRPAGDTPPWRGEPLQGRTVLALREQGLGDTLQFVRGAAALKARGARVHVACQPSLCDLVKTVPGVDAVFDETQTMPGGHHYVHLMDLPALLDGDYPMTMDEPYVSVDTGVMAHWERLLGATGPRRIGIAWQGNPNFQMDKFRSVPLAHFAPLHRPDVELLALQIGLGSEQIAQVNFPVLQPGALANGEPRSFMDTAALMKLCDLVITTDTSIAHLAGALGVKTWVILGFMPDWRWQVTGERTPWYPSVRLFRQRKRGDWIQVCDALCAALDVKQSENLDVEKRT
jgi:tetratricopeptide (TPR) repeat protein